MLTQLSFSQVTFYSSADFVYEISHKMRIQSAASIKNPMIELGIYMDIHGLDINKITLFDFMYEISHKMCVQCLIWI